MQAEGSLAGFRGITLVQKKNYTEKQGWKKLHRKTGLKKITPKNRAEKNYTKKTRLEKKNTTKTENNYTEKQVWKNTPKNKQTKKLYQKTEKIIQKTGLKKITTKNRKNYTEKQGRKNITPKNRAFFFFFSNECNTLPYFFLQDSK